MTRYRLRPVPADPEPFEAIQFLVGQSAHDFNSVYDFCMGHPNAQRGDGFRANLIPGGFELWVEKSSAWCKVEDTDVVIPEPDGTGFYPCKWTTFTAKYEQLGA